jgi:hypothetical protein
MVYRFVGNGKFVNLTMSNFTVAQDSILVLDAELLDGQLRKLGYKLIHIQF